MIASVATSQNWKGKGKKKKKKPAPPPLLGIKSWSILAILGVGDFTQIPNTYSQAYSQFIRAGTVVEPLPFLHFLAEYLFIYLFIYRFFTPAITIRIA
jgi:hypothetical protein